MQTIVKSASGGGGVSSVSGGTGITVTGTTTPSVALTNAGPGATGPLTYATVTINAQGQVTALAAGTAPVTTVTAADSSITITGGTTPIVSLGTLSDKTAITGGYTIKKDAMGAGDTPAENTYGFRLLNTTAATGSVVQYSPIISLQGNYWTGSLSKTFSMAMQLKTNSGASQFHWLASDNAAAYTSIANLTSAGALTLTSSLAATSAVFSSTVQGTTFTASSTTGTSGFAVVTIAPAFRSTGSVFCLSITAPNDTNQTLSTNAPDILYTGGTKQFATGALALYTPVNLVVGSISFVGASTAALTSGLKVVAVGKGTNATVTVATVALFESIGTEGTTVSELVLNKSAAQSNSTLRHAMALYAAGSEVGGVGVFRDGTGNHYPMLYSASGTCLGCFAGNTVAFTNFWPTSNGTISNGLSGNGWLKTYTGAIAGLTNGADLSLDCTLKNTVAANETTTATAGSGGAIPVTVQGYLSIKDSGGTTRKIAYYAV